MSSISRWIVVTLLISTGCSPKGDPNSAAYWIERLEDPGQRVDALRFLGRLEDPAATPHVIKWLAKDGTWQPDAAYVLGRLGQAQAIPALLAAIRYEITPGVENEAIKHRTNQHIARALVALDAKEAIPNLIRLLPTSSTPTKEVLIQALTHFKPPEAVAPLLAVLNEGPPVLIRSAVIALGEIGDAQAVHKLIPLLYRKPGGHEVSTETGFALLQIGAAAIPPLTEVLKQENASKRPPHSTPPSAAKPPPPPTGRVEGSIAFVLGTLRARNAEPDLLQAVKRLRFLPRTGESPQASSINQGLVEVIYALGQLGSKASAETISTLVLDRDEKVRIAAAESLALLRAPQGVPALFRAAGHGSEPVRQAAIASLSRFGGPEHLKKFDALAEQGDAVVSAEKMATMIKTHRVRLTAALECRADAECWAAKVGDENEKVRERAISELGRLSNGKHLAQLMAGTEDDSPTVRMASLFALDGYAADPKTTADSLMEVWQRWAGNANYRFVNAELKRVIVRTERRAPNDTP